MCKKSLAGWEEGDEALLEHLKHSGDCGWAIVAAVEAGDEELKTEDPMSDRMIQARKDTFGEFWPHDGKRGWTAKSQKVKFGSYVHLLLSVAKNLQMAESGWKYTPTLESDDNATCVYCNLSLDAWEPKDEPMYVASQY